MYAVGIYTSYETKCGLFGDEPHCCADTLNGSKNARISSPNYHHIRYDPGTSILGGSNDWAYETNRTGIFTNGAYHIAATVSSPCTEPSQLPEAI